MKIKLDPALYNIYYNLETQLSTGVLRKRKEPLSPLEKAALYYVRKNGNPDHKVAVRDIVTAVNKESY